MYKFLDPMLMTHFRNIETVYPVPGPGERWGPWLFHPRDYQPDDMACGPGGFHLMKNLDARYAQVPWGVWYAKGEGLLGEDFEKARFSRVRLRRIPRKTLHRLLRLGAATGRVLSSASLSSADLHNANFRYTVFRNSNLYGAILRGANLAGATLTNANLRYANLDNANLQDANLSCANLTNIDFSYTNFKGANLYHAILDDKIDFEAREAVFLNPYEWSTRT